MKVAERENEYRVFVAWQTAAFTGAAMVGKLPSFNEVLGRIRPQGSLKAYGALVGERFGIPMRPISPEAAAALMRLKEQRMGTA